MKKHSITLKRTIEIGNKLGINFEVITPSYLRKGMEVELEHGLIDSLTNITNNDLLITAKIALAHILEFPDYYIRLEKMENQAKKYWKE